MSRAGRIAAFLDRAGYGAARVTPLAQDASFRRYARLEGGPRAALLMDAPPEHEDVRPFVAMRDVLAGAGLSVPALVAADVADGLLLVEDFGDTLFADAATDANRTLLYDAAVDALAVLQAVPVAPALPCWTAAAMNSATGTTFLDWWWPAMFGQAAAEPAREAFAAAMSAMLAPLGGQALCLCHRDYFAGNLFWLPGRDGVRRVGIIDFQDAAASWPAYDLVSLVEDARRDLPEGLAARGIARLLAARPELDAAAFAAQFAVCAAQRHLRVACLWVRLARRDGKRGYLVHGPRCWALLQRALEHPATAPLAVFLDAHVPPDRRRNPDV